MSAAAGCHTPTTQDAPLLATQLELEPSEYTDSSQEAESPAASDLPSPDKKSVAPKLDLSFLPSLGPSTHQQPCEERMPFTSSYFIGAFEQSHRLTAQLTTIGGATLGHRFELIDCIGQGSFGVCFSALDHEQGRAVVAVKVARAREVEASQKALASYRYDHFLKTELDAYASVGAWDEASTCTGIPRVFAAGVHCFMPHEPDGRRCVVVSWMAMQRVGQSVWAACKEIRMCAFESDSEPDGWPDIGTQSKSEQEAVAPRQPSRAWIVQTGKGMIKALADLHARGFMHRDVKTENFCLDASNSNSSLFLIDYGFARHSYGYYSFHDANRPVASFWGTPDYASLSALMSRPQTPRDDLECVVYCLLEMESPTGRLPWHNTLTTNAEAKDGWDEQQLLKMRDKKATAWKRAVKQHEVPPYLTAYMDYITSLKAADVADYEWLLLVLDSGLSGQAPARPPHRFVLQDFPSFFDPGFDNASYARYAIQQTAAAAAAILPPPQARQASTLGGGDTAAALPAAQPEQAQDSHPHGQPASRKHARGAAAVSEQPGADDAQKQPRPNKRLRPLLWPDEHEEAASTQGADCVSCTPEDSAAADGGTEEEEGAGSSPAEGDGWSPEQLPGKAACWRRAQQQAPEPFDMQWPSADSSSADDDEE